MSKQIEVMIDDQPKHTAPNRAQVEEALKGYDVVSVLEVSARPNRQWLIVAEVNEVKKVAKPRAAAKPKAASKPKAKKKSLIGSDSDSE